jgi:C4-dicarboxylate-specific signal transduction histidine kinase
MSTGAIIAIVIVVLIALALIAFLLPRMRAKSRERQLIRQRGEVADAHRERASARTVRAEEAEQIAARERAEAELHETRARLHERGLADDELDAEDERLGDDRFTRERDSTVPPDEQTSRW